jgi:hypothetical protein
VLIELSNMRRVRDLREWLAMALVGCFPKDAQFVQQVFDSPLAKERNHVRVAKK